MAYRIIDVRGNREIYLTITAYIDYCIGDSQPPIQETEPDGTFPAMREDTYQGTMTNTKYTRRYKSKKVKIVLIVSGLQREISYYIFTSGSSAT